MFTIINFARNLRFFMAGIMVISLVMALCFPASIPAQSLAEVQMQLAKEKAEKEEKDRKEREIARQKLLEQQLAEQQRQAELAMQRQRELEAREEARLAAIKRAEELRRQKEALKSQQAASAKAASPVSNTRLSQDGNPKQSKAQVSVQNSQNKTITNKSIAIEKKEKQKAVSVLKPNVVDISPQPKQKQTKTQEPQTDSQSSVVKKSQPSLDDPMARVIQTSSLPKPQVSVVDPEHESNRNSNKPEVAGSRYMQSLVTNNSGEENSEAETSQSEDPVSASQVDSADDPNSKTEDITRQMQKQNQLYNLFHEPVLKRNATTALQSSAESELDRQIRSRKETTQRGPAQTASVGQRIATSPPQGQILEMGGGAALPVGNTEFFNTNDGSQKENGILSKDGSQNKTANKRFGSAQSLAYASEVDMDRVKETLARIEESQSVNSFMFFNISKDRFDTILKGIVITLIVIAFLIFRHRRGIANSRHFSRRAYRKY